jgi:hypothetical protein
VAFRVGRFWCLSGGCWVSRGAGLQLQVFVVNGAVGFRTGDSLKSAKANGAGDGLIPERGELQAGPRTLICMGGVS